MLISTTEVSISTVHDQSKLGGTGISQPIQQLGRSLAEYSEIRNGRSSLPDQQFRSPSS